MKTVTGLRSGTSVVLRSAPIAARPTVYAANYRWDFFTAAGTAMLLSAR